MDFLWGCHYIVNSFILASINIGSLKVGFGELLSGLFVKYNKDVATIYDLRFPTNHHFNVSRSGHCGFWCVIPGGIEKSTGRSGNYRYLKRGQVLLLVIITAFAPTLYFFTPIAAFAGGVVAFFMVYCLSWKGGLSPMRIILTGVAVNSLFTGLSSALNSMSGGGQNWCGSNR